MSGKLIRVFDAWPWQAKLYPKVGFTLDHEYNYYYWDHYSIELKC